jgi:cell division protein FtsL
VSTVAGNTALERPVTPGDGARARSRLRVVVARRFRWSSRFRPAHRLAFVAATLLVGIFLLVAASQAVVADRQIRIDNLQQQLATSVAQNENLEVQRAALTAPTRIFRIAEHQLGMVAPSQVTYLSPVTPDTPGAATTAKAPGK